MKHLPPTSYSIAPLSLQAHLFEVRCTVADPDPQGQAFALPAWIPGSYLVRDFARHVVAIGASSGRRPVALEKIDKHSWRAAPVAGPLTVRSEVYAWDLSVRGAHLDTTHGFFNGSCVFLRPLGREDRRCEIEILPPGGRSGARYRNWRVATAMRRNGARPWGFGGYAAADYDELIDHPVEIGEFSLASFRARGVAHDVAITGPHRADLSRPCFGRGRRAHGPARSRRRGPSAGGDAARLAPGPRSPTLFTAYALVARLASRTPAAPRRRPAVARPVLRPFRIGLHQQPDSIDLPSHVETTDRPDPRRPPRDRPSRGDAPPHPSDGGGTRRR